MKKSKGFTIIELLVVMIIGSIFLLSVGIISIIGIRSYDKYRREAQVYNDISYGFELIKNRVRHTPVAPDYATDEPWIGTALVVGDETFGLQQQGCVRDFVYYDVSDGKTWTISADIIGANFVPTISGKEITVCLSGEVEIYGDGDCSFHETGEVYESIGLPAIGLTTHITRRNP